jgi:hypothetical protein
LNTWLLAVAVAALLEAEAAEERVVLEPLQVFLLPLELLTQLP